MNTWIEVQMYVKFHKLPYTVIQFKKPDGCMIETLTGECVARSVAEAEKYLRG